MVKHVNCKWSPVCWDGGVLLGWWGVAGMVGCCWDGGVLLGFWVAGLLLGIPTWDDEVQLGRLGFGTTEEKRLRSTKVNGAWLRLITRYQLLYWKNPVTVIGDHPLLTFKRTWGFCVGSTLACAIGFRLTSICHSFEQDCLLRQWTRCQEWWQTQKTRWQRWWQK